MERYNWQDRRGYPDDRSGYRDQEHRQLDESAYRGAYRLDTESRHRDETTYNGFNRNEQNQDHYHDIEQHGGGYVYRRSRNLQDNDPYSGHQHRQSYGDSRLRGSDSNYRQQWHEQQRPDSGGFGSRYGGRAGIERDQERFGGDKEREEGYRTRFGGGNFSNDYGPDRYGSREPEENYGNMAGSLSYGYDGDFNVDPYAGRHYNPLTGELRSYRDQYIPRHQHRYGPPDKTGANPDYDRY